MVMRMNWNFFGAVDEDRILRSIVINRLENSVQMLQWILKFWHSVKGYHA